MSTFHTKLYAIQPRDADGRDQHKWVWKLYATQAGAVHAMWKMVLAADAVAPKVREKA